MDMKKFDEIFMKEVTKGLDEALVKICHVQLANVEDLAPIVLHFAKAYHDAMQQTDEILV